MTKEIEALEEIIDKFAEQMMRANKEEITATNKTNAIEYLYRTPQVRLLQQALLKAQELEKVIVELCEYYGFDNLYPYDDIAEIEATFKDTLDNYSLKRMKSISDLQKAEKLEKAWEVVKEKCVDMFVLKIASSVEHYNKTQKLEQYQLTDEDFKLLKEAIE